MNTQRERIMQYMRDFGSITPMDAFRDLGITKLSTRIGELEREGHMIRHQEERCKNRYGGNTWYMRYSLVKEG